MAGYVWIAGDTPGYLNWNRDLTKHTLVIYFLPTIGSTDPDVWLPTPTLIELGHGMYTPARQEMGMMSPTWDVFALGPTAGNQGRFKFIKSFLQRATGRQSLHGQEVDHYGVWLR